MAISVVLLVALPVAARAFPVARLRRVQPVVEVRGDAARGVAQSWMAARERNALSYGQWVRTGASGGADVLFNNGTRLALRANTQIQIVAPPSPSQPLVVRVVGALSEVFVKARGRTEIRTAAGTAAVRGTEYLVRLPDDNSTVLTVAEGAVDFFNERGRVLVVANQQSTATTTTAPTTPVAVDASGLIQWTTGLEGIPLDLETAGFISDSAARQALALRATGDSSGAIASLAGASSGDGLAVRMLLALDAGDAAAAVTAYEAAPQSQQDAGSALAVRALAALQNGLAMDAEAFAQRAVTAAPGLAAAHSTLALALAQNGKMRVAMQSATRAVTLVPASASGLATLAWVQFFNGSPKEADKTAQRALEQNPLSPLALLVYGRARLARGDRDEARRALGQAQALAPASAVLHRDLGEAWLSLGNAPRAEESFRRASETGTPAARAAALGGLGTALAARGQVEAADAAFKKALVLDAGAGSVRGRYGAFLIQHGRLAEADALLDARTESGRPDQVTDIAELIRLSELALLRQKLPAAQDYARRAVRLAPASAPARYQLGRVYLEQQRTTQAEEQFRQATVLDPDNASARFALGLTREQIESGKDPSRPAGSLSAVNATGVSSVVNLQNILSPGAPDRIQAAVQDPTVFRTASRAYGNTQLDGVLGSDNTKEYALSHLQESDDRHGAFGISATRNDSDGVRANADLLQETLGALMGIKSDNASYGLFGLFQQEYRRGGLNFQADPMPGALAETSRYTSRSPLTLIGGTIQHSQANKTRVLVGYDRPTISSLDSLGPSEYNLRSVRAELRHDRRVNAHFRLSSGLSTGRRSRSFVTALISPPLPTFTTLGGIALDETTAFLRAEVEATSELSVTGELKLQKLRQLTNTTTLIDDPLFPPFPPFITRQSTLVGLPTIIASYRPNDRATVRLRIRSLLGNISDFELLSPADVWSYADNDSLEHYLFGRSRTIELQTDYTFSDTSFLRFSLFEQRGDDLSLNQNQPAQLRDACLRALRLRYEGVLNETTTYFVRASMNDSRATDVLGGTPTTGSVAGLVRMSAEAGLFYLADAGWFIQPTVAFIGSSERDSTTRQRLGSYAVANFRVGKRFGLRNLLFVELLNATDKNYGITSVQKQGRQLRVGASARF